MNNRGKEHRRSDDPNYGADFRLDFEDVPENREGTGAEVAPLFGRGVVLALLVWGIVVVSITGGIAGVTPFWPLLPVVGAAVPLTLAFLAIWHAKNQRETLRGLETHASLDAQDADDRDERELLGALLQNGGLTPAVAAAHTSLGVSRAGDILERLAAKGHLEMQAIEGNLVYALRSFPSSALQEEPSPDPTAPPGPPAEPDEGSETPDAAASRLEDPLSDREFEVLKLLASGRTNREVAQELYVAPGTVKAHVANIYRKLDARNRAEALERARCLQLLG